MTYSLKSTLREDIFILRGEAVLAKANAMNKPSDAKPFHYLGQQFFTEVAHISRNVSSDTSNDTEHEIETVDLKEKFQPPCHELTLV